MQQEFPVCPGCHMRCDLVDPQCGKGYRLVKEWRETGSMTPGRRGPASGNPAMRLRFLLEMTSRQLPYQLEDTRADQLLGMLHRQGDFMKFDVLEEKARMSWEDLDRVIPWLEQRGLVETDWDAIMLTDEGAQAAEDCLQLKAVFSALTEEEQKALGDSLEKLMQSWR